MGHPLIARTIDALVGAYSGVAPTGRGGYRLARLARWFHARSDRAALFHTPDHLLLNLDLDVYPDCAMAFGLYELDTVRVLRRLLRPGDTVIDGGANIGYFTLLAAKAAGAGGRVHAFEPQPHNRGRLTEHVADNGLEDVVTIHGVGLSDRTGRVQFHTSPAANHGQSTMFAIPGRETRTVTIETVRLDDYLPDVAPRLIKLDLEGAEPLAISGMTESLRRHRPAVIVELNPSTLTQAGFSRREPIERLLYAVPDYRVSVISWRLKPFEDDDRSSEVNLLFQ
jgi:FkbM family methyltransferase